MTRNLTDFCAEIFIAIFSAIKSHKFFALFVAIYCVILVAFSRYAPNIDDLAWFAYISHGEMDFFSYGGGNPRNGRFYPFAFIDLLFLMKISTSPYLFFAVNAVLFTIFCVLYLKILELSNGKNALNSLITALLTLSVGFVIVFFGICFPEKIQVIWLSIFMLCSFCVIRDLGGGKSTKSTQSYEIISIISLNIALYYKEPTFIAAFAFGAVVLIFAIQNRHKDLAKYALCIIFSACFYVCLFVAVVIGNVEEFYTGMGGDALLKLILCTFNDSVIVFALCSIMLYRIYCVLIKKERIEPFFDGFLVASLGYFSAFVVLRIYEVYYTLPCYVMGIPSLFYFLRKYFCNIFIKICLILGLFGFLAQNLPSGIYKMIDLKAQGVQFHQTLDFVAQYLWENKGADIYFEGIGRGMEIYGFDAYMQGYWFAMYLRKFYKIYDFDLRTNAPNGIDFKTDYSNSFPILNNNKVDTPKTNDLIIVSNKSAFGDSLSVAQNRGELIFTSGFPSVPHIALMPIIKYLNAKYFKSDIFGKHNNFFALPRRTYVFRAN